jgi:hypothetical protein
MDIKIQEEERTDALSSIQTHSFFNEHKEFILTTGAILLTGSAIFASIKMINGEPVPAPPNKGETSNQNATKLTEQPTPIDSTYKLENEKPSVDSVKPTNQVVAGGKIEPNEHISIAANINNEMSFATAYHQARQEVGPGGIFSWHGQWYNTFTQEEWLQMSLLQRQEFLSDIGFQPVQTHSTNVLSAQVATPSPHFVEANINGSRAVAIDENHDGIAESILIEDEDTGVLVAFVDTTKDQTLDTSVVIDPLTMNIIQANPLQNPRIITMDELVSLNDFYQHSAGVNPDSELDDSTDEGSTDEDDYNNNMDVEDMI